MLLFFQESSRRSQVPTMVCGYKLSGIVLCPQGDVGVQPMNTERRRPMYDSLRVGP